MKNKIISLLLILIITQILSFGNSKNKFNVICLNKKKEYKGAEEISFRLKNIGLKKQCFYVGIEDIDLSLYEIMKNQKKKYEENKNFYEHAYSSIIPDILIGKGNINKTMVCLSPSETKVIKWVVPYNTTYRENPFESNNDSHSGSKCKLFLWEKDALKKEDRNIIYEFFLLYKKIKFDYEEYFKKNKSCIICLNKQKVFNKGDRIFFMIKNRCDKKVFIDLAVMTKNKEDELVALSTINDLYKVKNYRDLSKFKPDEEKIIFWIPKYKFLFNYKGLRKFDKNVNIKKLKGKKFYLYAYLFNPYKKELRKKIYAFSIR